MLRASALPRAGSVTATVEAAAATAARSSRAGRARSSAGAPPLRSCGHQHQQRQLHSELHHQHQQRRGLGGGGGGGAHGHGHGHGDLGDSPAPFLNESASRARELWEAPTYVLLAGCAWVVVDLLRRPEATVVSWAADEARARLRRKRDGEDVEAGHNYAYEEVVSTFRR